MPELGELALTVVTIFVASVVGGTLGLGFGITSSPVLLLALDPQTVVVLLNAVGLALHLMVGYHARAHIPLREVVPISLAAMAGVPVGVIALTTVSAGVLRICITGLIFLLAVTLGLNLPLPTRWPRPLGVATGFTVGGLMAALGVGAPILALYWIGRGLSRHAIRAAVSVFLSVAALAGLVGYAVSGLFTAERLMLILVAAFPAVAGFALATRLVHRLDERTFRTVVLAVVLSTSVAVIIREALRL